MGVIRMIKLFGWEHKMSKLLYEKRDEELAWIKTRELASLSNNVVKYVFIDSPEKNFADEL
jgi:hypothetical protein